MQKHEVEHLTLFSVVALPVLGWVTGAYIANIPLSPLPSAVTVALQMTKHNFWLAGGAGGGLLLALVTNWLLRTYGYDGFNGAAYLRWMRGTRIANWHSVKGLVNSANKRENNRRCKDGLTALPPIMIGNMPMPIHLENRNMMICASTGAGKSVSMESMIASAIKRRDKMVIVDPNGSYYSKFSFVGDTILNPYDTRTAGWSVFNEIQGSHDFERMAKSIIPPQIDANDEQWCGYARNVLADTMKKLSETGNPDQELLVKMLVRDDSEVIRGFLADTDSQGYFGENAEKAVASIRFIMNKYVRGLRGMTKGDFSIQKWINDPNSGNLFITWREDMRVAQLPMVATWIDTICATILSSEPMGDSRLWLFLDELESLGKLECFIPAATKGRKHGLRMVGSIQDWAQLDETYGRDAAKTLLACFRNYLIFGASNAYNSDKASEILGDQEVERWRVTHNMNLNGGGRSRHLSHEKERIIMDSEISNLNDLTGYIMFAEDFPVAKISLLYGNYSKRAVAIETKGAAC